VTVNVRVATVNVPVRWAPVLAPTVNVALPFPLPLAPDPTFSQEALLEAVHAHPVPAVTAMVEPAPPPAPIDWDVGLIV
jgi:hypothetical protein